MKKLLFILFLLPLLAIGQQSGKFKRVQITDKLAIGGTAFATGFDLSVYADMLINGIIQGHDGFNYSTLGFNPNGGSVVVGSLTQSANLLIYGTATATNFISNVATGTQPYAATSTTKNTNLNADLWDSYSKNSTSGFFPYDNGTNYIDSPLSVTSDSISSSGMLSFTDGKLTTTGHAIRYIQIPNNLGVGSGISDRIATGESVLQFGNNLADYYTGNIVQAKPGAMIRIDTRDITPALGTKNYSLFQIQTRAAGAAYTVYTVPFQFAAAPNGSMIMNSSGEVSLDHAFTVDNTGTFVDDVTVPTEVYSSSWNASNEVPTKDAIYDKIESLDTEITVSQRDLSWGESYITNFRDLTLNDGATYYPNSGGYEIGKMKTLDIWKKAALVMLPGAVKDSILYSVKPFESGQFDVLRDSVASQINADGYIENVAANVARIDYSDGDAALLLEEERDNLITTQETFSSFTLSGATLEGDPSTATGSDVQDGWNGIGGSSISGGSATGFTNAYTTGSTGFINARTGTDDDLLTLGKTYYYTFDIALNSGSWDGLTTVKIDGVVISTITSDGTYTGFGTASTIQTFFFRDGSGVSKNYTVSNFSVKEVTGFSSPSVDYPTSAYKLVASAASGYIQLTTALTITNAVDYANSIWVKRATGTGIVYIKDISNSETAISVDDIWQRFDVVSTSSSTSGQIGLKLATSGDEVYIAFAQSELGSYTTSFIYDGTEGSVTTRSADAISLSGLQSFLGSTTGSIIFDVDANGAIGSDNDLFVFKDTGAGSELGLRFTSAEVWQWYDHHSAALIGTVSSSDATKIGISWDGTSAIISKDGANESVTLTAAFDAITDITTGASFESALVKMILFYDIQLSATELNSLTD